MLDSNATDFSFDENDTQSGLPVRPVWPASVVDDENEVCPVEKVYAAFRSLSAATRLWAVVTPDTEVSMEWDVIADGMVRGNKVPLIDSELIRQLSELHWSALSAEVSAHRHFHLIHPTVPQLSFPLHGDFSPSKALTEFWLRGITALVKDSNVSGTGIALPSNETEVQQEFAKMLSALLGTIAQQIRYGTNRNLSLTDRGRFELQYQIQLCDRFLIIPDEASGFLNMLRDELINSTTRSVSIAGAWGKVIVNRAGDLCYELTPPNVIHDSSFIRSEEVE